MDELLSTIRNCTYCEEHLPLGPRPIVAAHLFSKIAIVGQAPGTKVHQTGVPWDDPSGRQLRKWLNVTDEQFYNEQLFALIPMGFCYPGKGKIRGFAATARMCPIMAQTFAGTNAES